MSASGQRNKLAPKALRNKDVPDYAAQVEEVAAALVAVRFSPLIFEPATYNGEGYISKVLLSLLKVFSECQSEDDVERIVSIGVRKKFFDSAHTCTPAQFYGFLKYLRSPAGADALADQNAKLKREKRALPGFTGAELCYEAMFEVQKADASKALAAVRKTYDEEVEKLETQLLLLKNERDAALVEEQTKFSPYCDYVLPDSSTFARLCWNKYKEAAEAAGTNLKRCNDANIVEAAEAFGDVVRSELLRDYIAQGEHKVQLERYIAESVAKFRATGRVDGPGDSTATLQEWILNKLCQYPRVMRKKMAEVTPMGTIGKKMKKRYSIELTSMLEEGTLDRPMRQRRRSRPPLPRRAEISASPLNTLRSHQRIEVIAEIREAGGGAIPVAMSKWEAGVRKLIGGGEVLRWAEDSAKYRGGGCFADAMKLLADADSRPPGKLLTHFFDLASARRALQLPTGLTVPDGPDCCSVRNFNNDATGGPVLRSFGVKRKTGLRDVLSEGMWGIYDDFGDGSLGVENLPFFSGRIGFRSKLVESEVALERMAGGKPIGRCVVMMDALEQAASNPLYKVLSEIAAGQVREPLSGFRNTVIRASSDWVHFWDEIRGSAVIVELDWKKFDRERAAEDIQFCIDVFVSCFEPKTPREERLLKAYAICMRRSLVERAFITDCGGAFFVDGMVPSGTLWTGFLDTALNILYITAALQDAGFSSDMAIPKCCGDDNLTLFFQDPGDDEIADLRERLNEYFRAGIEPEDFVVTRPPYFVTTEQACFPPGTDLSKGTSRLLDDAEWVPFEGEIYINQAEGRSHRWRYNFYGKPKFLSCYWLPNGHPIRPAHDNLEKLLFPEGIHKDISDYEAALLSMVVDNPFNHHNVNHLKHRYLIVQQIKRYSVLGLKPDYIMRMSRWRPKAGERAPFPLVAFWRRTDEWVDLDEEEEVRGWIDDFNSFVQGVSTLYYRTSTGGIDAYQFMALVRGEVSVTAGQWGNDVDEWLRYLHHHPASRYLKKARRHLTREEKEEDKAAARTKAFEAVHRSINRFRVKGFRDPREFSLWVAKRLLRNYGRMQKIK
ncbi:TPA_asm: fusion protein [Melampyrum roseum amalgavirus 1]|nr:TPA_asm: fusion protein [Melampyrum roseum amalgavirus 1]